MFCRGMGLVAKIYYCKTRCVQYSHIYQKEIIKIQKDFAFILCLDSNSTLKEPELGIEEMH